MDKTARKRTSGRKTFFRERLPPAESAARENAWKTASEPPPNRLWPFKADVLAALKP